ncbi:MAG TPA: DUF1761 domain-containing protein [Nitrospirota bacterium]|nr:DUF1761 domain-containing protein [Nitrospirota bacterium]
MAHVNYLAVLVASLAGMAVGSLWYSRSLFGTLWMRIIGQDKLTKAEIDQMQKDVRPYFVVMFVVTFMGAAVLARFIVWFGPASVAGGISIGFWSWLGFEIPVIAGNALFSGKEKDLLLPLFLVQAGHHFIALMVMGAILGAWL